jgi:hypothetical protein
MAVPPLPVVTEETTTDTVDASESSAAKPSQVDPVWAIPLPLDAPTNSGLQPAGPSLLAGSEIPRRGYVSTELL